MSRETIELWGGPKDGHVVPDNGASTYRILITEGLDVWEPSVTAKPGYRTGTYVRHTRARDGRAFYVWEGINTR